MEWVNEKLQKSDEAVEEECKEVKACSMKEVREGLRCCRKLSPIWQQKSEASEDALKWFPALVNCQTQPICFAHFDFCIVIVRNKK